MFILVAMQPNDQHLEGGSGILSDCSDIGTTLLAGEHRPTANVTFLFPRLCLYRCRNASSALPGSLNGFMATYWTKAYHTVHQTIGWMRKEEESLQGRESGRQVATVLWPMPHKLIIRHGRP